MITAWQCLQVDRLIITAVYLTASVGIGGLIAGTFSARMVPTTRAAHSVSAFRHACVITAILSSGTNPHINHRPR